MATSEYGSIYTPNLTGVTANVPVEMGKMAESLEGDTVVSFVNTQARDQRHGTLTAAQKKGVICFVEGDGPYISDGAVWRRISVPGLNTNRGTDQGTCDINGIRVINHGLPSAPVSVQVTLEGDASQIKYLSPAIVLINSSQFYVKYWYSDPAGNGGPIPNAGAYASCHWRAEL